MNQSYQIPDEIHKEICDNVDVHIDLVQGQVLRDYAIKAAKALEIYDRVAFQSCHMVGKTHLVGCVIVAYGSTRPHTKIVVTAPTFDQVRKNVFGEVHKRFNELPPEWQFGTMNQTEWNINEDTWVLGKSVQKSASKGMGEQESSKLQGVHSGDGCVLVVIDEAVGTENQVFTQVEGIASGDRDKVLLTLNPTNINCAAYHKVMSDEYYVIKVTCFDTPNFKHHGIDNVSQLLEIYREWQGIEAKNERILFLKKYNAIDPKCISVKWVLHRLREWGIDHPLFRSKCLGEWPLADMYSLISRNVVNKAIGREYEVQTKDETYIGVDVAGDGMDSTVFTTLDGYRQTDYESWPKTDAIEVCEYLVNYMRRGGRYGDSKIRIIVDAGFSFGVIATMKRWLLRDGHVDKMSIPKVDDSTKWEQNNIEFLEFGFGWTRWFRWHFGWVDEAEYTYKDIEEQRIIEEDQARYLNYKAKGFDMLATDCRNELDLLDLECYKKELPTIMLQSSGQAGKMKIESKDEYKVRTGMSSPDSSDALMLANVGRVFNRQQKSPFDYYEQ